MSITADNLPDFHEALKRRLTFPLAYKGGDVRAWQARVLPLLRETILPHDETSPFDPDVLETEDRGTHIAQKIALNITAYARITALLLIPKGEGPFAAVLALHDHGAFFEIGKEKCIAPLCDPKRALLAQTWADRFTSGRLTGAALVERGYVVLCCDALGWGDRMGQGYEGQQALASNLLNLGSSLAGLMALEDLRAAAFLASLPQTNPAKIAAFGFSMGGFRAWQLAALSPYITACIASCWMSSTKALMQAGNNQTRGQSAFYMTHPGLVQRLDYPDVASLAAPKPMYLFAGAQDALFARDATQDAFAKIARVYAAQGASACFQSEITLDGHCFLADHQNRAFDWLDQV